MSSEARASWRPLSQRVLTGPGRPVRRLPLASLADRPEVEEYARFRAATDHFRAPGGPPGRTRPATADLSGVPRAQATWTTTATCSGSWTSRSPAWPTTRRRRGLRPLPGPPAGRQRRRATTCGASATSSRPRRQHGRASRRLFTGGQDWGFPPLHPEAHASRRLRRTSGARLAHQLAPRGACVRIDHVMGLHRLYWVPDGRPATDGVYVRYPGEELYAVLLPGVSPVPAAVVVGENLGTVPAEVGPALAEHGIARHVRRSSTTIDPDSGGPAGDAVLPGTVAGLEHARHAYLRRLLDRRRDRRPGGERDDPAPTRCPAEHGTAASPGAPCARWPSGPTSDDAEDHAARPSSVLARLAAGDAATSSGGPRGPVAGTPAPERAGHRSSVRTGDARPARAWRRSRASRGGRRCWRYSPESVDVVAPSHGSWPPTPWRLPSRLSTGRPLPLQRGNHLRLYDKLGRTSDDGGRRGRHRTSPSGHPTPSESRDRRLQRLGPARDPTVGPGRLRHLGGLRPRRGQRHTSTSTGSLPPPGVPRRQGRPLRLLRRGAAGAPRRSCGTSSYQLAATTTGWPGAARAERPRRPDQHLRAPPRLVATGARGEGPAADLPRAGRSRWPTTWSAWASPTSSSCR